MTIYIISWPIFCTNYLLSRCILAFSHIYNKKCSFLIAVYIWSYGKHLTYDQDTFIVNFFSWVFLVGVQEVGRSVLFLSYNVPPCCKWFMDSLAGVTLFLRCLPISDFSICGIKIWPLFETLLGRSYLISWLNFLFKLLTVLYRCLKIIIVPNTWLLNSV